MAQQERTEKATARRRQRAKAQGQFAYSQELTTTLILIAGCVTIFYAFASPTGFRSFFSSVLQQAAAGDTTDLIRQSGIYFLKCASPVFAAAVVAALAGNVLQGMPVMASDRPMFKWSALNPVQGLSRLKGQMSWMQWLKLLVFVGVVAFVVWKTLSSSWEQIVTLPLRSIESANSIIRSVIIKIVTYTIVVGAVVAAADFFLQRRRFEESIKMTKPEVKEDMKATEGNPAIKGKIRSIQRAAGRRRMMARVKDATVIVTNPTHYAVALEYKPDSMGAPRVIAKGRDLIAQKIKALGRDHDIPTVENVPLARALYRLVDIDQEIPMELYKAVAEVLAYVYKIRKGVR